MLQKLTIQLAYIKRTYIQLSSHKYQLNIGYACCSRNYYFICQTDIVRQLQVHLAEHQPGIILMYIDMTETA
jgi:hypothetical protein